MNSKRGGLRLVGLALILAVASGAWAASEKVLYAFHGTDGGFGGNVVVGPDGNLYGTTVYGGKNLCPGSGGLGCGVAFRLTQGAGGKWRETVLHAFDEDNTDGSLPAGGLVIDKKGNLYGTTVYGGPLNQCSNQGCGVVFQLTPDGHGKWTETVLHSFGVTDGAWPFGGLIFDSAGNLYGTASIGGSSNACTGGCGVVFELTPGAGGRWTETVLYSFQGVDGEGPLATLTSDVAGNLYGTTEHGGAHGWGTVFKLAPGGGGKWTEKVLHSFDQTDGSEPGRGLVVDASGDLYGSTPFGGPHSWGIAFRLTPGGGGKWTETVLHSFDRNNVGGGYLSSGLVLDAAGNLSGAAYEGGTYGFGNVFKLTSDAKGRWSETVLHSFGEGKGGSTPSGLTIDPGGQLFGMTRYGGYLSGPCAQGGQYAGCGVVFEITP